MTMHLPYHQPEFTSLINTHNLHGVMESIKTTTNRLSLALVRPFIKKDIKNSPKKCCQSKLHTAILKGNVRTAIKMLAHGESAKEIDDTTGMSSLLYACLQGNVAISVALIAAGADINHTNDDNVGTLHLLALALRPEEKELEDIYNNDIDDVHSPNKCTLLTFIESILKREVHVDNKTVNLITPLMIASASGAASLVHLFLRNGADPNSRDVNGNTALHFACFQGHVSTVSTLLKDSRIQIDLENQYGQTAIDVARIQGHTHIVCILFQVYNEFSRSNPVQQRYSSTYTTEKLERQNSLDKKEDSINDVHTDRTLSISSSSSS